MSFSIGTLAQRAGVSVETIRYYEQLGLVSPRRRSPAGYRQYDDQGLARVLFVRRAAKLGFSLEETSELLALRARGGAPCGAVRARAEQKLATIEARLAELVELRDAVAKLVDACRGDRAFEHCSILAALEAPVPTVQPNAQENPCPPPNPKRPVRASRPARSASRTA